MNNGKLIILSCLLCSLFTSLTKVCPKTSKKKCDYISGGINFLLCIYVILKIFNII